ncbi:hypothetical protein CA267_016660 [Alteromonas pelagimontana]|uniref:Winged helix-turn-helix domain-containing protein n=1 Tax=Alteromonas pelagimontana TaxID=1858656 RepID=A0A6M4MI26_9ALTE|nr:helix-turn-helix domain-containing protein [Alteromonas pelagimontana]QJR82265.1 hypothetical protein CA267_016660 [Alteromonas pelagimontana]
MKKQNNIHSTSLVAQRQRLLEALRERSLTTVDCRNELNIIAPAPRIYELRHNYGHEILTERVTVADNHGRLHPRVARYHLMKNENCGG